MSNLPLVTNNSYAAGDGPKAILIEEMIEKYELQNRIKLMGPVPQDKVVDVMQTGHIFLVTSLTESFCIALLGNTLSYCNINVKIVLHLYYIILLYKITQRPLPVEWF